MDTGSEQQARSKRWVRFFTFREQPADELITSSGISFHLWRLYQHFWLVCLLFPLVELVRHPTPVVQLFVGMVALLFFAVGYTWLMWRHPIERGMRGKNRLHLQRTLLAVLALLALVMSLSYGLSFLWLFVGVGACAGVLLPLRSAFVVVSLLMFSPLVISVILAGGIAGVDWPATIALMLLVRALGLDMFGLVRFSHVIGELHATRKALARLKVEEERQRFSRDLHDVLGQTLSMITLKSELAKVLITEDPAQCAQEMTEIEQVARQSLREVRATVTGYRQPRFEQELEGAHQLLAAAGIEMQLDVRPNLFDCLPPETTAVFAWAVREGVTNIIRHSQARYCTITLTQEGQTARIEVINDREREGRAPGTPNLSGRPGVGLAGLRERVAARGGQMEAGPLLLAGRDHFRLRVELPLPRTPQVTRVPEERS